MTIKWQETENHLFTELEFPNFSKAFAFISELALEAERQQHHPDIHWVYNRVRIHLSTHDAGGTVTDKDRALARSIDRLLS